MLRQADPARPRTPQRCRARHRWAVAAICLPLAALSAAPTGRTGCATPAADPAVCSDGITSRGPGANRVPAPPLQTPTPAHLPADTGQRCREALATRTAASLRAKAVGLLDSRAVREPVTWTDAVLTALCATEQPMTADRVALAFALIEKESSFDAHGLLPGQPDGFRKLAYRLIDDLLAGRAADLERALGKGIASWTFEVATSTLTRLGLLSQASLRSLFDQQFERFRWKRVTTEWDIENIVAADLLTLADESSPTGLLLRAVLAAAPQLRERLASRAIFNSVGALQVGPGPTVLAAAQDGLTLSEAQARSVLYTRDGGVYYGIRQLKPLIAAYAGPGRLTAAASGFVAADYRVGRFASRNAALVAQVARLAGSTLPAEAPLDSVAVRELLLRLEDQLATPEGRRAGPGDMNSAPHAQAVGRFQDLAGQPELEQTDLYKSIRAAYRRRTGSEPALGQVIDARFYSAKTGPYRLGEIADKTRERFVSNCVRMGCGS
jgi:hypothetical protein